MPLKKMNASRVLRNVKSNVKKMPEIKLLHAEKTEKTPSVFIRGESTS